MQYFTLDLNESDSEKFLLDPVYRDEVTKDMKEFGKMQTRPLINWIGRKIPVARSVNDLRSDTFPTHEFGITFNFGDIKKTWE